MNVERTGNEEKRVGRGRGLVKITTYRWIKALSKAMRSPLSVKSFSDLWSIQESFEAPMARRVARFIGNLLSDIINEGPLAMSKSMCDHVIEKSITG